MYTIGMVDVQEYDKYIMLAFSQKKLQKKLSARLSARGTVYRLLSLAGEPEPEAEPEAGLEARIADPACMILLADQAAAVEIVGSVSIVKRAWYLAEPDIAPATTQLLTQAGWQLLSTRQSDEQIITCIDAFLTGVEAGERTGRSDGLYYSSSYEALVQALPDILYELDADGCFTFVNQAIALLGYKPDELVGRHYSVLLTEEDFQTVDRTKVLKDFSGHKTGERLSPKLFNERRAGSRRTTNLELRLRNRNSTPEASLDMLGEVISYGEVSAAGAYLRKDYQEFKGTVGIIRDITLRRKAEEMIRKLYQAVDQLKVSVFIVNHLFEIEYVNPCYFQFTGFIPSDLIGKNLFSFFHFAPARIQALQKIVQDGFEVKEAVEMIRQGSGRLWIELRLSPVRSPNGIVTHTIAIADDISQQRQVEELLATARKQAGAATAAKAKFLSAMTHELKNPVSGILTAAELMRHSPEDIERRSSIIIDNAHALMNLLSGILDFVRSEGDTGSFSLIDVPLRAYFENLCLPYQHQARSKGLTFELKIANSGQIQIEPERLGKIMQILLDNAIKFTEDGTIQVAIHTEHQEGNIPYLHVKVQDTGTGISLIDQESLFVPFSHNNQGARPSPRGAGIGLALARNLVRALGGELRHVPDCQTGTCFNLMLPIGIPVSEQLAGGILAYTVLLVDDNEINLEYMRTLMENSGFVIHTAIGALEALQVLDNHIIDAAVFDIYMPGYSGKELIQTIRANAGYRYDKDLPVFAMSAFDNPEIFDSGESGSLFNGGFPKPVDIGKLREAIKEEVELLPNPDVLSLQSLDEVHSLCAQSIQTCRVLTNMLEKTNPDTHRVSAQTEVNRLIKNLDVLGCKRGIGLLGQFLEHYAHEELAVLNSVILRIEHVFKHVLSGSK